MQRDIIFCKKTKLNVYLHSQVQQPLPSFEYTNPLSFFALAMSQTHFLVQMYSDIQVH